MNLPPRLDCDEDPTAISIEEALLRIQNKLTAKDSVETVFSGNALGRVLATDVRSPMSVPPFRASAMDGYALRVNEATHSLRIDSKSLAGHPGVDKLPVNACQQITTGARVPDDADAVVQLENVSRDGDTITINKMPQSGLNIRLPGSDSPSGATLMASGTLIGATQQALLAAHGINEIQIRKPLKVALFSTGDELVSPPDNLSNGQIYDANRPLLYSLLTSAAVTVIDLGIRRDSKKDIDQALLEAEDADLIVSSGGVSVGEADYVRHALEQRGSVDLWKIAMKPGRPLTFGLSSVGQPYFGLPGNPVSAALTALLFVKPAVRYLLGLEMIESPALALPVSDPLKKLPGRVEFQRAIMTKQHDGQWQVGTTGLQDSHVLTSLHNANCLIRLPSDSAGAEIGEIVHVIPFTHFLDNIL